MDENIMVYAAYSENDSLRRTSSSGAIFSLLAKKILNAFGVVYGVAMSEDCKNAEFIRVDSEKNLNRLQGSKYLQARVGNIFKRVREDLELGTTVLFTGTPCQINGLKMFLKKDYESLYCMDVVCHGVPSPKLWRQYVQYEEKLAKAGMISVNFRCKDHTWEDFGIKINTGYKEVYISKDKDPYMQMFLRDYCLRPSCYECVAKKEKYSDLTVADFWGIDRIYPKMNDGKGISMVIIRSEKGKAMFDRIKEDMVCKQTSYENGVKENTAEYSSAVRPLERDTFFQDMNDMDFEQLKNKYAKPKPVSYKKKVKKIIKKAISRTPLRKLIGGATIITMEF